MCLQGHHWHAHQGCGSLCLSIPKLEVFCRSWHQRCCFWLNRANGRADLEIAIVNALTFRNLMSTGVMHALSAPITCRTHQAQEDQEHCAALQALSDISSGKAHKKTCVQLGHGAKCHWKEIEWIRSNSCSSDSWSEPCVSCAGEADELRRRSIGLRPSEAGQPANFTLKSKPEAYASLGTADESLSRPQDGTSSSGADVSMPALQPISVERIPSASLNKSGGPQWLLFNDFSVSPAPPSEVTQLYGVQKVPCLLYYSQVFFPDLTYACLHV